MPATEVESLSTIWVLDPDAQEPIREPVFRIGDMLLVEERLHPRLLQPARRGDEVEHEAGREHDDVAHRDDAARRAPDHERLRDDDAELALRRPDPDGRRDLLLVRPRISSRGGCS